ncbi:NAD/NADP octopine/nopaline dehydrogenase family protein [Salimicrobium sp. PL1-032A]|uniref:NAD/NADP-dependent octopine/nopaline dehydrogenase family protein n=1 Tax=Salimicrobium sp. PL1-032A TaxID=3095364 RepID=UPI003261988C
MNKRFGIIGAGNGGHAFAAYLGMNDHEVIWYDIDSSVTEKLNEQGGVYVSGTLNGFAPIKHATTDIGYTLEHSDIVLVVAPANAHRAIARNCAPHLKDGQLIILNPGSTFGALEFQHELNQQGASADITLAETQSLLFACRLEQTGSVAIYGMKENLPIAAFPADKTESVYEIVSPVFPQWVKGQNVLEISLGNINAVLHPTPSLFNLRSIDDRIPFLHYHEGISENIGELIEKLDEERIAIGKAYGLNLTSTKQALKDFYGVKGDTIQQLTRDNEAYNSINGADTIANRYFTEDIPMGLVPMSDLARNAGVSTPIMDAVIQLVSTIIGEDFTSTGRTLKNVGVDSLSPHQVRTFVDHKHTPAISQG